MCDRDLVRDLGRKIVRLLRTDAPTQRDDYAHTWLASQRNTRDANNTNREYKETEHNLHRVCVEFVSKHRKDAKTSAQFPANAQEQTR